MLEVEMTLREAAVWSDRAGQDADLRSAELRPALGEWPTLSDVQAVLALLTRTRRTLLGAADFHLIPSGRLLVCQVNESITSGESEAETRGFFDVSDRPPWDTWIAAIGVGKEDSPALISWVPARLIERVGRGIDVNPYACIFWLSDADPAILASPVVQALRAGQYAL